MFTYTEKCGICGREAQYEFGLDILVCSSCCAQKSGNGWQPHDEADTPPNKGQAK
jgi:ribosomal protein L37AE/L43A